MGSPKRFRSEVFFFLELMFSLSRFLRSHCSHFFVYEKKIEEKIFVFKTWKYVFQSLILG